MSYIGLLDCNNFFVSCERLFRPDLVGKPVVVLSGNDGCVVARSNEVKALGIAMGVPYFQVKKELAAAGTTIFSSNFTLYRDISARVMAVLQAEMPTVEQYSVDEAFFGINLKEEQIPELLEQLRHTVQTKVGIPVSVGAAKTKTIAKYASEVGKKGRGTALVTGKNWQQAMKTLPIHEIWGMGRQTTEKLRQHGVLTVADFVALDRSRIERLFGVVGLRQHDELCERAVYGIGDAHGPQKSIMSTRSFKKETTDRSVVADALAYHVAHVAKELRELGLKAGYVSVIARPSRHGDWFLRGGAKELLLSHPSNDTRVLLKETLKAFDSLYEAGVPYKKAGVVVGNLAEEGTEQPDLFGEVMIETGAAALMQTLDGLNKRYGAEMVTVGRLKSGETWKSSKAFVSPQYTTKWADIRTIAV